MPFICFVILLCIANVHVRGIIQKPIPPHKKLSFLSVCQWVLSPADMIGFQVDMRDFINAPNGLSKQALAVNERVESDPSQSPLGGRTV